MNSFSTKPSLYVFISLFLLFAPQLHIEAAEFDLFESDRGVEKKAAPPPVPTNPFLQPPKKVEKPTPPPPPKPKPLKPQRDFLLRGTARLGEKFYAVLQAPDGKQITQRLKRGEKINLKDHGFPEYTLLWVGKREVKLAYPKDAPCQKSNEQKEVYCQENGKIALLKLKQMKALPPSKPVTPPAETQKKNVSPNPFAAAMQQKQLSPEEKAKREEARKKREEIYSRFKRKVIKDDEVPPGMRVVRTPFGDRLVPDNSNAGRNRADLLNQNR